MPAVGPLCFARHRFVTGSTFAGTSWTMILRMRRMDFSTTVSSRASTGGSGTTALPAGPRKQPAAAGTGKRRGWGRGVGVRGAANRQSLDRWEFVVDSRKILMTAVSVFLGNERIYIKTILVVLVCFVSFAAQVGTKPPCLPAIPIFPMASGRDSFQPIVVYVADEMGAID